jgi:hypothetical protein
MILEAAASHDLWILHAYFGLPGSCNDINALQRSPIFLAYERSEHQFLDYITSRAYCNSLTPIETVSIQLLDDFFLQFLIVDAFVGLTLIKLDGQNTLFLFLFFLLSLNLYPLLIQLQPFLLQVYHYLVMLTCPVNLHFLYINHFIKSNLPFS